MTTNQPGTHLFAQPTDVVTAAFKAATRRPAYRPFPTTDERNRLEDTCQHFDASDVDERDDLVCVGPIGHTGDHDYVPALHLRGLSFYGQPIYTRR